ncbi:MAG TPA: hypothetical protein VLL95_13240 [Phnomibacter sp.]|nr:hypothetical protein [Phnomibacter sp.]
MLAGNKIVMHIRQIVHFSLLSIIMMAYGQVAKAQKKTDKFLKYRDADSVWSVTEGFWFPSRFYIGDTRVKFRTWRDHLKLADEEVGTLMKKGMATQRTGNWIGISGFAVTLAGLRMAQVNSRSWGVPNEQKQTIGYIIAGVGTIATIVGLEMNFKAYRLYASGERLFNNKVRQGKLQPITLQLRAGPTQSSIIVGW